MPDPARVRVVLGVRELPEHVQRARHREVVVAPPTLSLTSSAPPTISRAAGHTVTWSTTSTGTVLYSLIRQVDGLDRYVQCAFDARPAAARSARSSSPSCLSLAAAARRSRR